MNTDHFDLIRRRYNKLAPTYDSNRRISERLRLEAIATLDLKPGDTVLDLGCGTGLSLGPIQRYIGPGGRITGVELSPEMLTRAREKVEENGWSNVTLVHGTAEEAELPSEISAALGYFTPEIIGSRQAIQRTMAALKPGGRFVVAGSKRAEGLTGIAVNLWYLFKNHPWNYFPWSYLLKRLWGGPQPYELMQSITESFHRRDYLGGCTYIAWAVK